jgi:6-phosphogluconolactonase
MIPLKNPFVLAVITLVAAVALGQNQITAPIPRRARFAYGVAADSRLSIYQIEEGTGFVRNRGYVLAPGNNPSALALDPQSRFLYLANRGSNDVAAFQITRDSGIGRLIWIGNVPADLGPAAIAEDSTGRFLYVANQIANDVTAYQINGTTGALTPLGNNVPTGAGPSSVAVDPSGKFVYIANLNTSVSS